MYYAKLIEQIEAIKNRCNGIRQICFTSAFEKLRPQKGYMLQNKPNIFVAPLLIQTRTDSFRVSVYEPRDSRRNKTLSFFARSLIHVNLLVSLGEILIQNEHGFLLCQCV